MALPTIISGVSFFTHYGYSGPFKSSGGNIYTVLRDSTTTSKLACVKATDPTSSFAIQDAALAPDVGAAVAGIGVFQVADVLHIATWAPVNPEVRYHTFNMATDAWGTKNETIEGLATQPVEHFKKGVQIVVRADGVIVVCYGGDTDTSMGEWGRADLAYKSGGAWTVGISLDNAGTSESNWGGALPILGSSNRTHVIFNNLTPDDGYQRTFKSDNTLETLPATFDAAVSGVAQLIPMPPGASYDSSGTQKIRCAYADVSQFISVVKFDSSDAPGAPGTFDANITASVAVKYSQTDAFLLGACLNDGNVVHVLYADNTTADLWHDKNTNDGGYGTDVEILDAVTINRISAAIYSRGGNRNIAYVYDDTGTIKYNERVLYSEGSVGASAGVATAAAVGRATKNAVGLSTGLSTVAGVGRATIKAAGASAGIATATGVGKSTAKAAGLSAGLATVTAVGQGVKAATGASAGIATAAATSKATKKSVGSSAGIAAATATSKATKNAVGASSGIATAAAVGRSTNKAAGSSAGVATAAAIARLIALAVGSSTGTCTVLATGRNNAAPSTSGGGITRVLGITDILSIT